MRWIVDRAYRARGALFALLRWQTRGVKVMAFNPVGDLLLVRHRYGRSDLFMLPGGGVKRGEAPDRAVRRELIEETGCRLTQVAPIGVYASTTEGRRDTVHLFRGVTTDIPIADGVELLEAGFFALDALPPATSPATRRRIDELAAGRVASDTW